MFYDRYPITTNNSEWGCVSPGLLFIGWGLSICKWIFTNSDVISKNVNSHVFLKSENNVKYVFWNMDFEDIFLLLQRVQIQNVTDATYHPVPTQTSATADTGDYTSCRINGTVNIPRAHISTRDQPLTVLCMTYHDNWLECWSIKWHVVHGSGQINSSPGRSNNKRNRFSQWLSRMCSDSFWDHCENLFRAWDNFGDETCRKNRRHDIWLALVEVRVDMAMSGRASTVTVCKFGILSHYHSLWYST